MTLTHCLFLFLKKKKIVSEKLLATQEVSLHILSYKK